MRLGRHSSPARDWNETYVQEIELKRIPLRYTGSKFVEKSLRDVNEKEEERPVGNNLGIHDQDQWTSRAWRKLLCNVIMQLRKVFQQSIDKISFTSYNM